MSRSALASQLKCSRSAFVKGSLSFRRTSEALLLQSFCDCEGGSNASSSLSSAKPSINPRTQNGSDRSEAAAGPSALWRVCVVPGRPVKLELLVLTVSPEA